MTAREKALEEALRGLHQASNAFVVDIPFGEYAGLGDLRFWMREARAALGAPTEAPCPDCVEDVCSRCYMETVNTPATVPPGLCSCFHAPEQHAFLGCTRCLCKWGGQLPKDGEP